MKTISIFFSTNKKYVPYLGVTIFSMLENASKEYRYEIYILHHELNQQDVDSLVELESENASIKCIDVSEYLKDHKFYGGILETTKHISQETFYRMLIPDVLDSDEKIIYLDCDTVILGDISELYEMDLQGKTIGAVYSVEHWTNDRKSNPPNSEHEWFNAGVMVVDLKKYRQNKYAERCKKLMLNTTFDMGDQDVLRIVSNNDTHYFPYEWNAMWHHAITPVNGLNRDNYDIYQQVMCSPKIVHYTTGVKPWNYKKGELADLFWKYAKQTPFSNQIVLENEDSDSESIENALNGFYVFPKEIVPKGAKIILYGAGRVGRSYYRQITESNWCEIVGWADKNIENILYGDVKKLSPDEIINAIYDYIVIAINNEKDANTIKKYLVQEGIDAEKVVWFNWFLASPEEKRC